VILDKLHLLTPLGSVCYDVEKLTGSRHSGNSHIANVWRIPWRYLPC